MAGRLQVSYEELQQAASVFNQQSGTIDEALRAVQSQVDAIQSYWESTTEDAFLQEWQQTLPKFQRLVQTLQQSGQALNMVAQTLQTAEQEAAAGIARTVTANDGA